MSITTIADEIAAAVGAVSGVELVLTAPPATTTEGQNDALDRRVAGGVVSWWEVSAAPAPDVLGVGWRLARHRITVRGFYNVARDRPISDEPSDRRFATLLAAVAAALSPVTLRVGMESSPPSPSPITDRFVPVSGDRVRCHTATIVVDVQEEPS